MPPPPPVTTGTRSRLSVSAVHCVGSQPPITPVTYLASTSGWAKARDENEQKFPDFKAPLPKIAKAGWQNSLPRPAGNLQSHATLPTMKRSRSVPNGACLRKGFYDEDPNMSTTFAQIDAFDQKS